MRIQSDSQSKDDNMDTEYVELNRSFHKLNTASDLTDEAYSAEIGFGLRSELTWVELLMLPRVIVLAEAGSGKTIEFARQTEALNSQGKRAFFLRLEHMSERIDTAFEIGDAAAFDSWQNEDTEAYFFLDSVDEAKLIDPQQFRKAIRVFATAVGSDNMQRISVYISSRITRWLPKSDLAYVEQHLP